VTRDAKPAAAKRAFWAIKKTGYQGKEAENRRGLPISKPLMNPKYSLPSSASKSAQDRDLKKLGFGPISTLPPDGPRDRK
jgi:hypothetical protein